MITLDQVLRYNNKAIAEILIAEGELGSADIAISILEALEKRDGEIKKDMLESVRVRLAIDGNIDEYEKFKKKMSDIGVQIEPATDWAVLSGNPNFLKHLLDSGETLLEGETSIDVFIRLQSARKKIDVEAIRGRVKQYSMYEKRDSLAWSVILDNLEMFDLLAKQTTHQPESYINALDLAADIDASDFVQKISSIPSVMDKLLDDVKSNSDIDNYNCGDRIDFKLISMLGESNKEKVFNVIERDEKVLKRLMESASFRSGLADHMPKKYIQYMDIKREKDSKITNTSLLKTNAYLFNRDLLDAIEKENIEVLKYLTDSSKNNEKISPSIDYPRNDRRIKRYIGPLLLSLLSGKQESFSFLFGVPGIYESEKEMIDIYQSSGWLLERTDDVRQRDRLTKNVGLRKDKLEALLEHKKLMLKMAPQTSPDSPKARRSI